MAMSRELQWSPDWLYVRIAMDARIADLKRRRDEVTRPILRQSMDESIREYERVRDELNIFLP